MATSVSIWRRWFCMTSLRGRKVKRKWNTWCILCQIKNQAKMLTFWLEREREFIKFLTPQNVSKHIMLSYRIIPKSSKYPPLPLVPKGSLNVRTTLATLSLFQIGPNILFPNLEETMRVMLDCNLCVTISSFSERWWWLENLFVSLLNLNCINMPCFRPPGIQFRHVTATDELCTMWHGSWNKTALN